MHCVAAVAGSRHSLICRSVLEVDDVIKHRRGKCRVGTKMPLLERNDFIHDVVEFQRMPLRRE